MENYSKFISEERRAKPTPKSMVNPDGTCVFGTFDKEFEEMELLKIKNPTHLPDFLNKFKLTLWEATEVHFKEGVLLAVVCDMGIFGKLMNVFYDKQTHYVYCWDTQISSKATTIAPNLINGSIAEGRLGETFVKYVNNFEKGKCSLSGKSVGNCLVTKPSKEKTAVQAMKENVEEASIEYAVELERLSLPSVVSIPFATDRPRPLYSQKDFFKVKGSLTINGKTYKSDDFTTAIVDDHRGYYPRKAHYDWVTTMGNYELDGKMQYIAFNLTRNQSIDQDKYNENLLWQVGKTSLLTPVTFERSIASADFKDYSEWTIKDEHDMVNVKFKVYGINPMIVHVDHIVRIDYYITFGVLEGYLRDEDGKKIILDGMMGMGEDKSLLL